MTSDTRSATYPLEALRKRESWRLETLQAELAEAMRRTTESAEGRDTLQRAYRTLARSVSPSLASIIDPGLAAQRLVYLSDLQRRAVDAALRVITLERARDRLRARSLEQQARSESIEAHRKSHLRAVVALADRNQAAEADRDWLARSNWRRLRFNALAERVEETSIDPSGRPN